MQTILIINPDAKAPIYKVGTQRDRAWRVLKSGMTLEEFRDVLRQGDIPPYVASDLFKIAVRTGYGRLVEVPDEAVEFRKVPVETADLPRWLVSA